jgi:hypothetical protein
MNRDPKGTTVSGYNGKDWREQERKAIRYFESYGHRLYDHEGNTIVKTVRYYEPVDDDTIDAHGVSDFSLTNFIKHLCEEL